MVVVMIIAVVSVSVAVSFGRSTDRTARLEADRFMAVMNEVRDEAVIAGTGYLLNMDEKSQTYSFESTRSGAPATANDDLFRARSIGDEVEIEWTVLETLEEDPNVAPKVYITSLGELTPFELRLSGDKTDYIVRVNDEGMLEREEKAQLGFR